MLRLGSWKRSKLAQARQMQSGIVNKSRQKSSLSYEVKHSTTNYRSIAPATTRPSHKSLTMPTQRRQEALKKVEIVLNHGLAKSTSRKYDQGIRKYLEFCKSINMNEEEALPCTDDILCMFLCDGVGKWGSSHAKSLISSIRSWHVCNGYDWKPSLRLSLIKKGLDYYKSNEENAKSPRLPVTPKMIRLLSQRWRKGSAIQKCALACALAAWTGQMRLGEILPQSIRLLERRKLPHWKDFTCAQASGGTSSLRLPWTKTTCWRGDTVNFSIQTPPFNASDALKRHKSTSNLSNQHLLCEYRDEGQVRILDKESFMSMCNSVWLSHSFAKYTGHSFRIGGTTMLLRSGITPEVVKKMGRWKSDAFQLYWCDLNEIFKAQSPNLDLNDW